MHLFWFKSHLSLLPDDCVSFSVSTMWAGRNSLLCSTPHRDKGRCKHRMLCDEAGATCQSKGRIDDNRRLPKWKGWDHRQPFFQQRKLFTPQEARKKPAEMIKPVMRMKSSLRQSVCRNGSAGSPGWGWNCGSVNQPKQFNPRIGQEPGL